MNLEYSIGNSLPFKSIKSISLVAPLITEFKKNLSVKQSENNFDKGAKIYRAPLSYAH
jgi:hypothetical protein